MPINKDEEQILVVPSQIIFAKEKWQGLKTDNLDYYIDLIKNNYEFKRRGDVENDPSFQQIIPYIIFNFQDKCFIYKYLPKAGEQRLVDSYQIGVGGHINKEDINGNTDVLEAGMMREWSEEVDFKGNLLEKKLVGILNDDTRTVEAVHLGLVYKFFGDSSEISIKETDKMAGELVAINKIEEHIKGNFGSIWTQIVYREYLKKILDQKHYTD